MLNSVNSNSDNNNTIEVAEVFEPLFTSNILNFILPGGRVSGKSKTTEILVGITTAIKPNEDIVIARASYGSIADSVYNETVEVIESIPAFEDKFIFRKSPLRIVRKSTSSTIYFMGIGGSTDRTKGFKPKHEVGLVVLEETQELKSREHLDQTMASLRRRFGDDCKVVIVFNPPAQSLHWINLWTNEKKTDDDYCVIHSTYEDILPFLSDRDVKEIRKYMYENKTYYDYIYGGIPTGVMGSVYPMFNKDRHVLTPQEFDRILERSNIRVVGCIIGGDGAVTHDCTAFVPQILLSNGQTVIGPIFYHNPLTDGVIGFHQLVQNNLTRWFDELCRRFHLGTTQEKREHPTAQLLPIWIRIDSASPDLIQECRFFIGDRCQIGPIKKASVMEMVATVQSSIANDNVYVIDYGGYYDYQCNRWVQKDTNLLVEQIMMLIWNEQQTNYDPIVPNDVCDAFTYGDFFWYSNQENIQYFNILKLNNMQNIKIYDILNNRN